MPHDREMKVLRPHLEKYKNVEDHVKVNHIVTSVRERDHKEANFVRYNVGMRNSPPKRVKKVSEDENEPFSLSATKNFEPEIYGGFMRVQHAETNGRNFHMETCNKIFSDKKEAKGKYEIENDEFVSIFFSLFISVNPFKQL